MIIKVIEVAHEPTFTKYNEVRKSIQGEHRYTLSERFLNTEHIVSFVEADPSHYEGHLPEGLMEGQRFTYITFTQNKKGITIVDSPEQLQKKINTIRKNGDLKGVLKG